MFHYNNMALSEEKTVVESWFCDEDIYIFFHRGNGVKAECFLNQQCENTTKPGIKPKTFPLLERCSTIWAILA